MHLRIQPWVSLVVRFGCGGDVMVTVLTQGRGALRSVSGNEVTSPTRSLDHAHIVLTREG